MVYKMNESIIVIQAGAINPIQTNVVFWSHDRGTAKLRMKLVRKNGIPQSLPEGTAVPIRLIFKSATAEGGYGKHDYLATIEDRVNGIVSIVLEDNILGYVGKVEGSVYIDFPDDRSLDTAGRFTFDIKRSPIDDSTPELENYYFNGFSQTIDKIEKILADGKQEIDQKIAESETQIDGKLNAANEKIDKFADKMNSQWDNWNKFVQDSKDVLENIDPNGALLTKLNETNKNLDQRGINVLALGLKNDGITDNYDKLTKIASTLSSGSKLFFPAGKYVLSNNFPFRKQIHIEGIKPKYENGDLVDGTVFTGGGVYFRAGSSGSTVKNVGVINKNKPNGFDIREEISNITIDNCITIARDHGFLIESYTGLVKDTTVSNCQTHDGIHGFISKAQNTNFINCQANKHSSWGFGAIADNIPASDRKGEAINNKISDCRAIECGVGFSQYKRDYFSNVGDLSCVGNQFSNCSAIDCTVPLSLGDAVGDTGGGKYTSFPVADTTIVNFNETGSASPARAYQTINLNISGISLSQNMTLRRDANNVDVAISSVTGGKAGQLFDIQELERGSVPSLKFGRYFRTNNSEKMIIADFKDGKDGETYEINLWDNNTTIKGSSTVFLLGPSIAGRGSSIRFKYQDGV
ncbi:BppU family phage baseplate upper protein, partial [Enterococcus faecium]